MRLSRAARAGIEASLPRRVAKAFGAQLQRIRRDRGWKQDAFAAAMGVSRTTASNIERGAQRIFLDQVYRAAAIFGVPIDALLPPAHLFAADVVVHAAADDPLSRTEARTLAKTVEEVLREIESAPPQRQHLMKE